MFGDAGGDSELEAALSAELDARFEEVTSRPPPAQANGPEAAGAQASRESDTRAARDMFIELAALHLCQVRDVMLEVRFGKLPPASMGPCAKALEALEAAALQLGDKDTRAHLQTLGARIRETSQKAELDRETKQSLLDAYEPLVALRPELLGLESERQRREPVIVYSLLSQIPGVQKLELERLYAAGLGRLEALMGSRAEEIAVTTGIDQSVAERIVSGVREYQGQFGSTAASLDRSRERDRLAQLLGDLRQAQQVFESASESWSETAAEEKRQSREARTQILLQVDVVLARLGEVERLEALRKMPVLRRIERLNAFLSELAT